MHRTSRAAAIALPALVPFAFLMACAAGDASPVAEETGDASVDSRLPKPRADDVTSDAREAEPVEAGAACSTPKACKPGVVENGAACGYCGTAPRRCNTSCAWISETCKNEVTTPDRCMAGTSVDRAEGCTGGVMRPWTCSATCTWVTPSITCEDAATALVVGGTIGHKSSRDVRLRDDTILRVVAGDAPCKLSGPPFNTASHYAYLQLRNPNAKATTVDLSIAPSTAGPTSLSLMVAGYAVLPDTTASTRGQCMTGADLCISSGSEVPCLGGNDGLRIPANSSIWIYVANKESFDPALDFTLSATVTALAP